MNYCRLRTFKTKGKQKPRDWSRAASFPLPFAWLEALRSRRGHSGGPKAAPGQECGGPYEAGTLPGSRERSQDRGKGSEPRTGRNDKARQDAQPPTVRPAQTTLPVRPRGRARAAVCVSGASSQSQRGRGERRPPPMLFSLSRGAGVVGGGAILEGTSARSRAAPGRGPGRRHAVPGGLSGEWVCARRGRRAAGHGRCGGAGGSRGKEAAPPLPHSSEWLTGSLPPPSLPLPRVPAVIEQLPMDLRDRFTEMREMDLQVQSTWVPPPPPPPAPCAPAPLRPAGTGPTAAPPSQAGSARPARQEGGEAAPLRPAAAAPPALPRCPGAVASPPQPCRGSPAPPLGPGAPRRLPRAERAEPSAAEARRGAGRTPLALSRQPPARPAPPPAPLRRKEGPSGAPFPGLCCSQRHFPWHVPNSLDFWSLRAVMVAWNMSYVPLLPVGSVMLSLKLSSQLPNNMGRCHLLGPLCPSWHANKYTLYFRFHTNYINA